MTSTLEQRIDLLERQNRRFRYALTLLAVAAGLGAALVSIGAARREPAPKVVEAQSFNLVDAAGKVRATLLATEAGPRLRFLDAQGKNRVSIGCEDGGAAFVTLLDATEQPRLLCVASDSQTLLQTFAASHEARAGIGMQGDASGVQLFDAKGHERAGMVQRNE